MTCVARQLDPQRAEQLTLVLSSLAIAYQLQTSPRGIGIWVAAPHAHFASRQLARYEAETRGAAVEPAPETTMPDIWSSLIVAGGLALLHLLVSLEADQRLFLDAYGAMAAKILSGELYRCVTALLLHTTPAHLLGNVAALLLFGPFICQRFGQGWGWTLVLGSGVAGNLITAWVRGAPHMGQHLSVGASTAVFGALGILVAINIRRRRRTLGSARWRVWAPLAGGLGFLAFMGSAPGSDLLAHLFGFGGGLAIGALAYLMWPRPASGWRQVPPAIGALALLAWAWSQGIPAP